jgi:site-specific DNA recombinase
VKRDVVYARVSSEEQKRNETVKGQIEEVRKHAATKGVTIASVYTDEGVSGSTMLSRRPQGAELMRDVEAGTIGTVYVWKFDRASRNLRDFLNLTEQCERYGVSIVSVTQPIPSGPSGRLMLQLLGSFAEFDRSNIKENMMRGHATKVTSGGWGGGRFAYGYMVEGEQRTAKLVLHPVHAGIVRGMFNAYDSGKNCQDIANDLNKRGIPTPRSGTLWRPNTVLGILKNVLYTGSGKWRKRQWVKRTDNPDKVQLKLTPERAIDIQVPSIVSRELFDRVQAKLAGNQLAAMAHASVEYLLRQKITCGICGLRYTGRGNYYSCTGRHCAKRLYGDTREACPAPNVNRADLEAAVWSRIHGFLKKPGKVIRELEKQIAVESHPLRLAGKVRDAEKERAGQAAKLERIRELFVEGEITKSKRLEMTERVTTATAALDTQIQALRKEQALATAAERSLAAAQTVLESLAEVAGNPTFAQKRRAVEILLESVVVGKDGKCRIAFVFEPEHTRSANGYSPSYAKALLTIETHLPERPRARRTA